jgi:hypothetical protein
MTNKPISRKANIVVQDLETEVLIYDLTINKAFCLNQTAGLVYQLCDGRRTVAEISDLMSKELKTLVSEDFVWLALDGLKKDNLLENADELANHFAGLTSFDGDAATYFFGSCPKCSLCTKRMRFAGRDCNSYSDCRS